MLSLSDMAEISCHNYRRPNLRIIMTLKIFHDLVSNLVFPFPMKKKISINSKWFLVQCFCTNFITEKTIKS